MSGIYPILSEVFIFLFFFFWELWILTISFLGRGAFDISLIASIASHLTYWGDEDVNHFMLSQMLSRESRHRNKQL